jgi:transposase
MLEFIARQLDDVEGQMARHVKEHHAQVAKLLESVPAADGDPRLLS